jgi:ubiquinone/menaquinone biosynthesis C-methylase UbiE
MINHPSNRDERVRDLFDAKAASWSAKYALGGDLTGRLERFVSALDLHIKPPARVLDLGCGTGDLALVLASKGMTVTAIDISTEMLTRASAQDNDAAVEWVHLQTHWKTLPFDSGRFDAVVASSVLEYVDDIHLVLREIARVVADGGFVYCTVPDPQHLRRRIESLVAPMARSSIGERLSGSSGRSANYLAYLRISRQRHTVSWWNNIARSVRLNPLKKQESKGVRHPLRLLIYQRSSGL